MTGALVFLGAPRQRSASNLSVASQARPSGSVIKATHLPACVLLLWTSLQVYGPQCGTDVTGQLGK